MNKSKIAVIITAIVLYILSASAAYLFFAKAAPQKIASPLPAATVGTNGQTIFDNSLPKTQACPINGALYSKQQEAVVAKTQAIGSHD